MRVRRDHHAGAGQRSRTSGRWRGAAVVGAAALSLAAGAVPASAAGGYTVTATIPVGSEPAGVAVDPAAGTVYVANYNAGTVSVIDEATRAVTATIPVGIEPAGVAVDPATHTVYVTNHAHGGTVSVIDEATRAVTATIPVGTGPYGVAVDPATRTVYVTNDDAGTVSVIDAATRAVTATIPVGTGPEGVAVDPATHTAYVTNLRSDTVSVIDEATRAVTATIPVGSYPYGVAVDPSNHIAYVTNDGDGMSVIDEAIRAVTATIPVGNSPDGVAVDPSTHAAYVTNGNSDTVSVITPPPPPAAPSGLAARLAGPVSGPPSDVVLTWTDNATDPAATRVRVERASGPGFTAGLTDFTAAAAATSYTDTAVAEGATYYYRVLAENDDTTSGWSDPVSITFTTVPAAPATLTATVTGPVSGPPAGVTLHWTGTAGAAPVTHMVLRRATDPGFTTALADFPLGPAATSYTDTAVTQGTTYYYRVRAENEASNSAWSNTVSILVPRPVPTAPANLTARAYTPGFASAAIDLTWTENPAPAVTGFTIQAATSPAFTAVTTSTAGPAIRKYTLTGLRRHTRYYIRIKSVNGPATSGWTTTTVTTP